MSWARDTAAITEAMRLYFDGLYHADTKILAQVFHPDARYVNATNNDYMNLSVVEYFNAVDQRTPPAQTNAPRHDIIKTITFGGPEMAFVRARMSMMKRDYLDFLTFIKVGENWQIMSKTFTYTDQEE